jgi:thiol-disulfide isomerase/thioredoxin
MMIKKAAAVLIAVMTLAGCGVRNDSGSTVSAAPPAKTAEATWTKPAETDSLSPEDRQIQESMTDTPAPDFTVQKGDGTKVAMADLKGKPLVLNFWATWCPYCVGEFGMFTQAAKDFPDFSFYAVDTWEKKDLSVKENRDEAAKFAKDNGLELPILYDVGNGAADGVFGFQGLPATLFIDAKGSIRWYMPGAFKDYDQLKRFLNALKKL